MFTYCQVSKYALNGYENLNTNLAPADFRTVGFCEIQQTFATEREIANCLKPFLLDT